MTAQSPRQTVLRTTHVVYCHNFIATPFLFVDFGHLLHKRDTECNIKNLPLLFTGTKQIHTV